MSVLFERDEKTIRKHINNVFSEKELAKENNTHFLRVDGVKQPLAFYSLDVIICEVCQGAQGLEVFADYV